MKRLLALAVLLLVALPAFAGGKSAALSGASIVQPSPGFKTFPTPTKGWDLDNTMTGTSGVLTVPAPGGIYDVSLAATFSFIAPPSNTGYVALQLVDGNGQNKAQGSGVNIPGKGCYVTAGRKVSLGPGTYHMTVINDTGAPATVFGQFSLTLIQ